ncbi:hypothetical protein CL616_02605 [archaeon]|nr:hypothetical protein [archaeon]|tara:strand:- start:353 stop:907 length:555 start_codon:yes stop_codon:yes gene_type:complete
MKTTNARYIPFERVSGPESEVGKIIIPELLTHTSYNSFLYANEVNGLQICDLVDNNLSPNEERTREAREQHILRSPRVMAMNRSGKRGKKPNVFFRGRKGLDELFYIKHEGQTIETWNNRDYVFKSQVAAEYLGISADKFREIMASGEIGIYEGNHSHQQLRTGDAINRSNIQAFLLHELNRFK